ncbi:uncharacterized protein [Drosophila takahashii]|uniref:uncharacterized protein n=1 Tax=Drosophila takahashii TaxID=29030 RepID=UPI001CF8F66E|nr:uncharacterized protein LOC108068522 [Drosophila takahashii]
MNKSKSERFGPSQEVGVPRTASGSVKDLQASDRNLCGKPSFLVCRGKKSPDMTEVDSSTDLREPNGSNLQQTALKIHGIMKHQRNIIEMVDDANNNI